MTACSDAQPIREVPLASGSMPSKELLESATPWIARGYLNDWPVVKKASHSDESALSYLLEFYQGRPVSAFLAEPEAKGRFFYNQDVTAFNICACNFYEIFNLLRFKIR